RFSRDWSSDVCSSDLQRSQAPPRNPRFFPDFPQGGLLVRLPLFPFSLGKRPPGVPILDEQNFRPAIPATEHHPACRYFLQAVHNLSALVLDHGTGTVLFRRTFLRPSPGPKVRFLSENVPGPAILAYHNGNADGRAIPPSARENGDQPDRIAGHFRTALLDGSASSHDRVVTSV